MGFEVPPKPGLPIGLDTTAHYTHKPIGATDMVPRSVSTPMPYQPPSVIPLTVHVSAPQILQRPGFSG